MNSTEYRSSAAISLRILELQKEKQVQEDKFKEMFNEFTESLDPVSMIKRSLHDLATDNEMKGDLLKVGMVLGTNFIIENTFGNKNLQEFLNSTVIKKISAALINGEAIPELLKRLSNVVKPNSGNKTTTESSK